MRIYANGHYIHFQLSGAPTAADRARARPRGSCEYITEARPFDPCTSFACAATALSEPLTSSACLHCRMHTWPAGLSLPRPYASQASEPYAPKFLPSPTEPTSAVAELADVRVAARVPRHLAPARDEWRRGAVRRSRMRRLEQLLPPPSFPEATRRRAACRHTHVAHLRV